MIVAPSDRLLDIFHLMCQKIKKEENKYYHETELTFLYETQDISSHFYNNDEVRQLNFPSNADINILLIKKRHLIGQFYKYILL